MEFDPSFVKPIPRKGRTLGGYTFKMPSGLFLWVVIGLLILVVIGVTRTSPESIWEFATYMSVALVLLSTALYLYFHNVQGTSIWVFDSHLQIHHGFRRRKIPIAKLYPRIALIENGRDSDNPSIDLYVIHSAEHEIYWYSNYLGDDHHAEQRALMTEVVDQLNDLLTEARQGLFLEED